MLCEDAITSIIDNDNITNDLKGYCIEQNQSVLEKMLQYNASDEVINIVCKAYSIYPTSDIKDAMKEAEISSRYTLTPNDRAVLDSVILYDVQMQVSTNKYLGR